MSFSLPYLVIKRNSPVGYDPCPIHPVRWVLGESCQVLNAGGCNPQEPPNSSLSDPAQDGWLWEFSYFCVGFQQHVMFNPVSSASWLLCGTPHSQILQHLPRDSEAQIYKTPDLCFIHLSVIGGGVSPSFFLIRILGVSIPSSVFPHSGPGPPPFQPARRRPPTTSLGWSETGKGNPCFSGWNFKAIKWNRWPDV